MLFILRIINSLLRFSLNIPGLVELTYKKRQPYNIVHCSNKYKRDTSYCHHLQGVLLYGPPGTGKTLLARAVAHHTECTFIRVSGSELVQKFIGEGARMVRELFVMARYSNP